MPNRALTAPLTRSIAGLLSCLMVAMALCALAACATTKPAAGDPRLEGPWRLDPQASDDVAKKVAQAVSQAQARLRKRLRAAGGSGRPGAAGASPGGQQGADTDQSFDSAGDLLGNGLVIGPDFGQLRQRLQDALSTPTTLALQVQPGEVDIRRDGLPADDYQSGQAVTRFDEYGAARLSSRWTGQAFEILQRYTSGAQLIERYEIDPSGALVYTRELKDPTVGRLTVKSVYHHA